jgi:hypothetical protein
MKNYVESAIATSTNNDDTQKKKLQAGLEFFMFVKDHPSTENYEVDDGKRIRLNHIAIFINAEHLTEDQAFDRTGIRASATRPHVISAIHQAALIGLFLTERRMGVPRPKSDVTQPGGGCICAPTTTKLCLARLLSFIHELEDRLVLTRVFPQEYPVTRRDCDNGPFKVLPGLLNAFYRDAVKWDTGCAASKKAPRISTAEFKERAASEEFAQLYSFHSQMLMEHAMTRYINWAGTVCGLRQTALHKVDVRILFPVPPRTKLHVPPPPTPPPPPGDTKMYNNALYEWVVIMYFQTADKNQDINFKMNQLTYFRDAIPIVNVYAGDGSLTIPIATIIMMLLQAHKYLVATCVGPPVSTMLLKKVVRNTFGNSLAVIDCFELDADWSPGSLKMIRCPVEKVDMLLKALQAAPPCWRHRLGGRWLLLLRQW